MVLESILGCSFIFKEINCSALLLPCVYRTAEENLGESVKEGNVALHFLIVEAWQHCQTRLHHRIKTVNVLTWRPGKAAVGVQLIYIYIFFFTEPLFWQPSLALLGFISQQVDTREGQWSRGVLDSPGFQPFTAHHYPSQAYGKIFSNCLSK